MARVTIDGRPALQRFQAARRKKRVGQFRQPHSGSTGNGKTACTHACVQLIVFIWTGVWISIDRVNQIAAGHSRQLRGTDGSPRGLRAHEVNTVFRYFKLPYRLTANMPAGDLIRASRLGPVLWGSRYGDYARRKGLPPWRARPPYAKVEGADQLAGFDDAHANVLGGDIPLYGPGDRIVDYDLYIFEPNHPRPGRSVPLWDVISSAQFRQAYEAIKTTAWNSTYAFVPTRALAK